MNWMLAVQALGDPSMPGIRPSFWIKIPCVEDKFERNATVDGKGDRGAGALNEGAMLLILDSWRYSERGLVCSRP